MTNPIDEPLDFWARMRIICALLVAVGLPFLAFIGIGNRTDELEVGDQLTDGAHTTTLVRFRNSADITIMLPANWKEVDSNPEAWVLTAPDNHARIGIHTQSKKDAASLSNFRDRMQKDWLAERDEVGWEETDTEAGEGYFAQYEEEGVRVVLLVPESSNHCHLIVLHCAAEVYKLNRDFSLQFMRSLLVRSPLSDPAH